MLDKKLLEILACPVCKGELQYQAEAAELVCPKDQLAFPIQDEIPVLLSSAARELN